MPVKSAFETLRRVSLLALLSGGLLTSSCCKDDDNAAQPNGNTNGNGNGNGNGGGGNGSSGSAPFDTVIQANNVVLDWQGNAANPNAISISFPSSMVDVLDSANATTADKSFPNGLGTTYRTSNNPALSDFYVCTTDLPGGGTLHFPNVKLVDQRNDGGATFGTRLSPVFTMTHVVNGTVVERYHYATPEPADDVSDTVGKMYATAHLQSQYLQRSKPTATHPGLLSVTPANDALQMNEWNNILINGTDISSFVFVKDTTAFLLPGPGW